MPFRLPPLRGALKPEGRGSLALGGFIPLFLGVILALTFPRASLAWAVATPLAAPVKGIEMAKARPAFGEAMAYSRETENRITRIETRLMAKEAAEEGENGFSFRPARSLQTGKKLRPTALTFSGSEPKVSVAKNPEAERWPVPGFGPAPSFTSADGRFSIKPRGRLYVDAGYRSDAERVNADEGWDSELRTARLGISGHAGRIDYVLEMSFQGKQVDITSAALRYKFAQYFTLSLGHFKPPVSLERLTSSRFMTFMERSGLATAFGFNRAYGATLAYAKEGLTATFGVFGGSFVEKPAQDPLTIAGRLTQVFPVTGGLLHLGVSSQYRQLNAPLPSLRYAHRPHAHLARHKYVDTGALPVGSDYFFGVEAAWVQGPYSIQSEWGWHHTSLLAGLPDGQLDPMTGEAFLGDPAFDGGYVEMSVFLTGESRSYKGGRFGRPTVRRPLGEGWGALQLAARVDFLDLEDARVAVFGGRQTVYALGVNWYLTPWSRLMFNFALADIHASQRAAVALTDNLGENEVTSASVRAQFDF